MSVFRKIAASFTRPQTRGDQFPHVKRNEIDPSDKWLTTGELGDGAFGKVYRVYCHILRTLLAYFVIEDAGKI